MTGGPIEFLTDSVAQEVPRTEMGGADGLIQPEVDSELLATPEATGGHVLDGRAVGGGVNGEVSAMMSRAAMRPLSPMEAWTGEPDNGEEIYDPVTGRQVSPDLNKESSGERGELSDLKPGQ